VPDRATFETLARRDDVPGQIGAEEMKFLVLGVDAPQPALFFLNTNTYSYHFKFASEAVHIGISLAEFNTRTYFRDDRSNLAGTIIAHDRFVPAPGSAEGLYALEFWPTDPVRARHVTAGLRAREGGDGFRRRAARLPPRRRHAGGAPA